MPSETLRRPRTRCSCRRLRPYTRPAQEDDVWQKSQVDPVVKQLEAADKQQDAYMTAFRYINDGYAALPDGEAQKTDALVVQRTFKDFKFRVNDGYGAEADKILQMGQNPQTKQEFLTQIGAWQWYVKAAQAAQQVRYLLGERAKTKGEFVKGELKTACRQTDLAIADLLPHHHRHDGPSHAERRPHRPLHPAEGLRALRPRVLSAEARARTTQRPTRSRSPNRDVTPVEPEACPERTRIRHSPLRPLPPDFRNLSRNSYPTTSDFRNPGLLCHQARRIAGIEISLQQG